MKTDLFQSCGHCWVLQICWHIECSTFTESSFRIWNSSTGIPSPPWDLFKLPHDWATELNWNLDNPDLFSPKPQKMPNLFFYFISNVWSFSLVIFSSVQSLSRVWLFATPLTAAHQASLSITNSQSLLRLTSIKSVMPSSHLTLCRPLLLLPPIPFSSCPQSLPASESFPISQLLDADICE